MKQGATPSSGALSSVAVRDTAVIYAAAISDAQELGAARYAAKHTSTTTQNDFATVARRPACA